MLMSSYPGAHLLRNQYRPHRFQRLPIHITLKDNKIGLVGQARLFDSVSPTARCKRGERDARAAPGRDHLRECR
jgi:hypothetical protein